MHQLSILDSFGSARERAEAAIAAIKAGQGVLIVDDEDRENEGDLIYAAETITPKQMALLINETLKEFFMTANLRLIDFKIEFGRLASDPSQIVLADEISPDTCRLWDVATGKKMDKDRFRQGLGGFMEAYADVLDRLQK